MKLAKYLFGAVAALAVLALCPHRSGACPRGGGCRSCGSPRRRLADQYGRHGVDAHIHGPRPDDDDPGPGPVLWRHGAQEERARHRHAGLRSDLHRHRRCGW